MFLVKREESRDFDVFFGVFLGFFWHLGERKNVESSGQKANFRKMCVLPIWGMLGAIYSPGHENRGGGRAVGSSSRAASLRPPLIRLILTPLDRFSFSVSKKV